MSVHAPNHVTCKYGVKNNYIFGIYDPDMPIHYITFMELRWRLRVVYRDAQIIGSVVCTIGRISPSRNWIQVTRARATARVPWSGRHPARPGIAPPLVGGLSAVSFWSLLSRRYVNCAADYSAGVASRSCHAGSHIYAGVSIKTFYVNTAASLKQLSRVSSVQRVNFREDIAAAKRELLSDSEH